MSEIRQWLEGLGLSQYTDAFEANEITLDFARDLTDADLEKLGVAVMGHRKALLRAIADLTADTSHTPQPKASADQAPHTAEAERRQLTVMFCDLVDSTALSGMLDPEDFREVMRAYQETAAVVVRRYEGYVAKYLGDGILVYFGYPQAHEDDAERAVRTGLAMVEAVAALRPRPDLSLASRIGIATGLVVVGDMVGDGISEERAVSGETPNLAARLQAFAEPDTVVIGTSTHALVEGLFICEDLGPQSLKGISEPVRSYRVREETSAHGRFEARARRLTALVGRDHEVGLLLERWQRAKEGEGQVVLLSGEAGIGKSRITLAVRERVASEPHTRLRYQCSPYYTNSAFYPIIDQLERAAGFARGDTPEAKLDKLEALLAQSAENVTEIAPLFAAMLSLPLDRYPPLDITPQKQKENTIAALADQVTLLANRQPVLIIFEDAHSIDPTTLEVLGAVIERVRDAAVLMVITYRPEFEPPWAGHDHVSTLTLNRLSRRHGAEMIAGVIGSKALPDEIMDQIVAKTDGVPLFVEELTKTVLEAGFLKDVGDRYELDGPLPPLAIPSTLQGSLMARLDRLSPVKEVAQIGACIGREFPYELLAAVSPLRDNELQDSLQQLTNSELIFRRGTAPDSTYTFKHALVQDAAYGSLLKSKRQQLHARIARVLEKRFLPSGPNNPEILADHLTKAGLEDKAIQYWIMAGVRAKALFANDEATVHLQVTLDLMNRSKDDELGNMSFRQQKMQVLVMLGDIASQMGDLEHANQYYEEALKLPLDEDLRQWIENKRHRQSYTIRDGARLVYYEHGSGEETLLFINPILYGLAVFHPILEELCQEFRIVTVDCRGAGMSEPLPQRYSMHQHAEDAAAIIEALGGEPVIGVGISYGSNQLFRLAHSHPHLLKKIVTIGSPLGCILSDNPTPCPMEYIRRIKEAIEGGNSEAAVKIHAEQIFSEPGTKALIKFFCDLCSHLSPETVLSFFNCEPTIDITSILATVEQPTLVTHGTADLLIPFAAATYITERLPNAQIYGFHEKGHLPIFTATGEFCDVLRKFVYEASVGAPAQ